ncbi:hypothetical protein HHK36_017685 [Tetracentron sinense]|uniref:Receptor-like serine/threonine-protein kinase n=1 Tax=Tetracentron sinense TaxID=13715 RepID=A0A835DA51_TETSI|nr:hypothetical protein HHK36_017685 [Tetracentron sinense]
MAYVLQLPFSLLLLLPLLPFSVAQTDRNVSLNSSLSALDNNSSWPSPSGEFAFGFHRLENKDLFLLAIWFNKIPQKTVVWYANGDNPVPRGSKVELTTDGHLLLNDPQGNEIWKASSMGGQASNAAMLDTGNFVIASRNSGYLWESFNNPADTILPTQILEVGGKLSSRQKVANYSIGRFQLRLLPDGNLVLNTIALPTEFAYAAYYISNTFEADPMDSGYRVVFNESGYLYIERRNGNILNLTSGNIVPIRDFYYRATLDFDGVFTQYSYPRNSTGNESWSSVWSIPDDICDDIRGEWGSGACGFNSYCILTSEKRPTCDCPQDYSPVDPNDKFSGCEPNFMQGCDEDEPGSPEDLFEFQELAGTDWPTSDYERLEPYNKEECKRSCLHDCHCAVAIFRGGTCWKKKLPLSNGRVSRTDTGEALIKIRKADTPSQNQPRPPVSNTKKKDQGTLILVGSVLLGSSVFFNFLLLTAISLVMFFMYHKKQRRDSQVKGAPLEINLRSFTYQELEEATDGFKDELGRGAFGIVYKGAVEMGSCNLVAVKKLDHVQEIEKEFKTEVSVIGQTHHKNLVRLLGFCDEGQHRLLVYEFMNNGDLAHFLFGIMKPDWNLRIKIAFGIARGLLYLHEECSSQIIHCDIKPQNILLDDYFTPRISDFGLAKLLLSDQSRTRTGIRGTKGYVAAEWFRNMPITAKVDVYSFGVMLLEIICCRKSVDAEVSGEERAILTDWAYDCYREGKLDALVENDIEAMSDMRRLERLVKVAIWCIQEEPSLRPTMKKVTQMLEGIIEVAVPPCPCPFSYVSSSINMPE